MRHDESLGLDDRSASLEAELLVTQLPRVLHDYTVSGERPSKERGKGLSGGFVLDQDTVEPTVDLLDFPGKFDPILDHIGKFSLLSIYVQESVLLELWNDHPGQAH